MKTIAELEAEVNKAIGGKKDSKVLMHLVAPKKGDKISGLSSGSAVMNDALSGSPGVGYGWGRIVELYGPEQSGKTTLALHLVAEAQKIGVPCMYIDAEHACDPAYMEAVGINLEELSFNQPDYGEQALEIVISGAKAGYKLIIVDSVAALTPLAELQGTMGDAHVGRMARMMGQGLRKITGLVSSQKVLLVFINQIREKVGVMFGNPEVTPGGKALKFFSSYRIEIRSPRGGKIEERGTGDLITDEAEANKKKKALQVEVGTASNVKVVKNKLYPPFRKATFNIVYGKGIDKVADAVEYLRIKGAFGASGKQEIKLNGSGYTRKALLEDLRKPNSKALKRATVQALKQVAKR